MATKRDLSSPLDSVSLRCNPCRHTFDAAPDAVEDDPSAEHHPYRYIAAGPYCGQPSGQAPYHKGLLKAWANATGPKTAEGKAATARNLDGPPTPEEAKRTRFNAMKHDMNAETAQYFPAKPDGYAACASCDVDRVLPQPAGLRAPDTAVYGDARGIRAAQPQAPDADHGQHAGQHRGDHPADPADHHRRWREAGDTGLGDFPRGDVVLGEYNDIATGQRHRIMEVKGRPR